MNIDLTPAQGIRYKLLRANNPLLLRRGPSGIDKIGSFVPPKRKVNSWVVKQNDVSVLNQLRTLEMNGARRITVLERIDCRIRKLTKSLAPAADRPTPA